MRKLCSERAEWGERLHPRLPYLTGEVIWAVRFEMARTLEDALSRRTRALLLDARAAIECAPAAAALMAAELGWSAEHMQLQIDEFHTLAAGYLLEPVTPRCEP